MRYSGDVVEIPGDGTDSGFGMPNGYSNEYVVTSGVQNGVDMTQQYHDMQDDGSQSHAAAVLTYPNHYAPAGPMMTTVPYCAPLVADPYIVHHAGVSYPHQVTLHFSLVCLGSPLIWKN